MSNEKIEISKEELALVSGNLLNEKQLQLLFSKTPDRFKKTRPAKGGGEWDYVSGGYIRKMLNLMFGWDWDFEILWESVQGGEVIVKGKLTCRVQEGKLSSVTRQISKTQFGNKEIAYKKTADKNGDKIPLSLGNDFKAAATDCLKKCASQLGIAGDIYDKDEFRELDIKADSEDIAEEIELLKSRAEVEKYYESLSVIDKSNPAIKELIQKKLLTLRQ